MSRNRRKNKPKQLQEFLQAKPAEQKAEETVELSDAAPKLNKDAGLMFGNHNTQIQEAEAAEAAEKAAREAAKKAITPVIEPVEPSEPAAEQPAPQAEETEPSPGQPAEAPATPPEAIEDDPSQVVVLEEPVVFSKGTQVKKRSFVAAGVLLFLFAIVGVVCSVYFVATGIRSVVNQDSLRAVLEANVYPLVVVDTPEFESADRLDQKVVISAGIWKFIMEQEDKDKYEHDDFGTMTVPKADIEPYIRRLFGKDVVIAHQMIPDVDFYIPYDEETGVYYIPSSTQLLPYAPKIMSIKNTGDAIFEVEVGYMLPGPFWNISKYIDEEPGKVMKFTMEKQNHNDYTILSVEQVASPGQQGIFNSSSSMPEDGGFMPGNTSSLPDLESTPSETSEPVSSEVIPSAPESTPESAPAEPTPSEQVPAA